MGNLNKARESWERLTRILGRKGANIFQGGGTGVADFRVRDVFSDSPHGTGPRKISTRVCKAYNKETADETGGRRVVIPATDGSNGGGDI